MASRTHHRSEMSGIRHLIEVMPTSGSNEDGALENPSGFAEIEIREARQDFVKSASGERTINEGRRLRIDDLPTYDRPAERYLSVASQRRFRLPFHAIGRFDVIDTDGRAAALCARGMGDRETAQVMKMGALRARWRMPHEVKERRRDVRTDHLAKRLGRSRAGGPWDANVLSAHVSHTVIRKRESDSEIMEVIREFPLNGVARSFEANAAAIPARPLILVRRKLRPPGLCVVCHI